ncbi:MAG: putative selenium-dependent hydroxylase accessory protein YqeC [Mogibacterium sp.]|nr:putative selenium-dependent hydroxylase accessory protein YqeC [Mogibacterium sp.]
MKLWNYKGQQNTISEALQLTLPLRSGRATVISFVGAGGKTSLIFAWARELASAGKKIIITTTTHMLHPDYSEGAYSGSAIIYPADYAADEARFAEEYAEIDRLLGEEGILMLTSEDASNCRKVVSAPEHIFDYACKVSDIVLIEADGSRRMPLKLPREHEPQVPNCTDVSICVAGMSSLGKPVSEAVYGAEMIPSPLARDTVDKTLIAAVLSSPDAGLKGTCGDYRVFLNQADTEELQEKSEHLQKMFAVRGIQSAWGSLLND